MDKKENEKLEAFARETKSIISSQKKMLEHTERVYEQAQRIKYFGTKLDEEYGSPAIGALLILLEQLKEDLKPIENIAQHLRVEGHRVGYSDLFTSIEKDPATNEV
ncbi:hypothetical protein FACS189490_13700 [Clostridia bacterium]|nr:hypothetical protein FACS189490_13700 [Clostridia bacterium]